MGTTISTIFNIIMAHDTALASPPPITAADFR
jgi:hypothetical protein